MDYAAARKKAEKIVSEMTVEEKMSQLLFNAPAIERLGIEEYNWWNEALHGVARAGTATVFPQAIMLAATFNPALVNECADVISTEGRAKYNKSVEYGDRDIFKGLTYWSPNINIFRDPRWGRGHETYGEDPFLTSVMGESFIKGIQGDGEFMKASATSKHFYAHSGPELDRHGFDAKISKKDEEETYLPAFFKTVKAGVSGVMGAYNRVNGIPANCMPVIREMLRGEWGFEGYFVSDCGALNDIHEHHHYTKTAQEAAAAALKAGCDLNCGDCYIHLNDAYEEDLITEEDITEAAVRLFTIRALLGEFEEKRPYSDIPFTKVDCRQHRELNLRAAEQGAVLLKNENGFLPLDKNRALNIGVVGPNSVSVTALEGNYEGKASEYITFADGIRRVFENSEIRVAQGCNYFIEEFCSWDGHRNILSDGTAVASVSDITFLCLGLDSSCEGEGEGADGSGADRKSVGLPAVQRKLAKSVLDHCENVVAVVMCGSSMDIGEDILSRAKAVIYGWYPGAQGGLALAKLIAGEQSPCGKLPITVYSEKNNIPDMKDYSMKGRTYRFIEEEPLFPFGFGLNYTDISFESAVVTGITDDEIRLKVTVKNGGGFDVTEKAQVYAKFADSKTAVPNCQLCAVEPVFVRAGETAQAELTVDRYWIKAVDEDGTRREPDGAVTLYIGASQPDALSRRLGAPAPVEVKIK
ncbi:MAG: glycoside hydrolase family 3 C-terminal domain-containing protein [Clostridia bacterium]|nr:glycoside hydrolase family 3 C-terminal domain-containing protein [Clostridia bacterium]